MLVINTVSSTMHRNTLRVVIVSGGDVWFRKASFVLVAGLKIATCYRCRDYSGNQRKLNEGRNTVRLR